MVRSLWTAATGMIAQQNNVDTIANNLANVNTTGYKTETNEFKSLLYQTLQTKTTTANAEQKPIGAQVGLGVRNASITSQFSNGALLESESTTSFAVQGKGFFAVRGNDGQTYYTRNGDFNFMLNAQGGLTLANSDGLPVLNTNGQPITLNGDYIASRVEVDATGQVMYPDAQNNPQPIAGLQIGMYQFQNPKGLVKEGDSLFSVTVASGQAMNEATNNNLEKSVIRQGYLEGSNVQVADEMVNLIVAQRAYELNSKAITTTDSMMETANQLKR
ncbi:MAG: flagellar hook-basal body protein [Lachnospiraceae bacterium]|nr:flagellar hook-basal body protein [Lachnospiraceae bacterium]